MAMIRRTVPDATRQQRSRPRQPTGQPAPNKARQAVAIAARELPNEPDEPAVRSPRVLDRPGVRSLAELPWRSSATWYQRAPNKARPTVAIAAQPGRRTAQPAYSDPDVPDAKRTQIDASRSQVGIKRSQIARCIAYPTRRKAKPARPAQNEPKSTQVELIPAQSEASSPGQNEPKSTQADGNPAQSEAKAPGAKRTQIDASQSQFGRRKANPTSSIVGPMSPGEGEPNPAQSEANVPDARRTQIDASRSQTGTKRDPTRPAQNEPKSTQVEARSVVAKRIPVFDSRTHFVRRQSQPNPAWARADSVGAKTNPNRRKSKPDRRKARPTRGAKSEADGRAATIAGPGSSDEPSRRIVRSPHRVWTGPLFEQQPSTCAVFERRAGLPNEPDKGAMRSASGWIVGKSDRPRCCRGGGAHPGRTEERRHGRRSTRLRPTVTSRVGSARCRSCRLCRGPGRSRFGDQGRLLR